MQPRSRHPQQPRSRGLTHKPAVDDAMVVAQDALGCGGQVDDQRPCLQRHRDGRQSCQAAAATGTAKHSSSTMRAAAACELQREPVKAHLQASPRILLCPTHSCAALETPGRQPGLQWRWGAGCQATRSKEGRPAGGGQAAPGGRQAAARRRRPAARRASNPQPLCTPS